MLPVIIAGTYYAFVIYKHTYITKQTHMKHTQNTENAWFGQGLVCAWSVFK
jgi:hypothetical protein